MMTDEVYVSSKYSRMASRLLFETTESGQPHGKARLMEAV